MPGTLGSLLTDRARVDIPLEDGKAIYVLYRPGAMTPRLRARLAQYVGRDVATLSEAESDDLMEAMTDLLAALATDWDIQYPDEETTDPDTGEIIVIPGGKMPCTRAAMADMGYDEQNLLLSAIQEHASFSKPSGATPDAPLPLPTSRVAQRAISHPKSRTGTR